MGKTILVAARKGGVGKTTTTVSLGIGLAREGNRVLLIDADSQHSLTASLGVREPEKCKVTLSTVISEIIGECGIDTTAGIIRHTEGVDFLPSNNTLAGIELVLAPLIGRESILRQYIEKMKPLYDYIIIDTAPTLDLLTINALAAADSVIIPICPKFLDALGLEQLLKAVAQIRRQINPLLAVECILLTMADRRANHSRDIVSLVENACRGTYTAQEIAEECGMYSLMGTPMRMSITRPSSKRRSVSMRSGAASAKRSVVPGRKRRTACTSVKSWTRNAASCWWGV